MKRFSVLSAIVVSVTLTAACGIQEPTSPSDDPVVEDTTTPVADDAGGVDVDVDTGNGDVDVDVDVEPDDDAPVEEEVVDPEPEYLPAPFKLAASEVNGEDGWRFSFSSLYISDAPCGEARGDWTGMLGWDVGEGIALTQGEGGYLYFEINREFDEEVVMSYIQGGSCGDNQNGWAQYGSVDQLSQMSPEALEWIYCGWADNGDGSGSCNIRLHISADAVEPMGNMHNHNFNP